jgi:hypothetical protein
MKATAALTILMLATSAMFAEEAKPDYSRPTLLRIVVEQEREQQRAIRIEGGTVTFRALGARWRFMPIMLPFIGTRFTTTREWPDAFSLTGTQFATTPRSFRTRRELNKELRRIEKITKPKATVKVKVSSD